MYILNCDRQKFCPILLQKVKKQRKILYKYSRIVNISGAAGGRFAQTVKSIGHFLQKAANGAVFCGNVESFGVLQ